MYERMLNKSEQPSFSELLAYCGESGAYWHELDQYMHEHYDLVSEIRFPYGKDYGWRINYKHRKKYICDVHAEKDAFTVFLQLRCETIDKIKNKLSEYALMIWEKRYPCGYGGWIRYRVTKCEQLPEVYLILAAKVKPIA